MCYVLTNLIPYNPKVSAEEAIDSPEKLSILEVTEEQPPLPLQRSHEGDYYC